MKIPFFLSIFFIFVNALSIDDIKTDFREGRYELACESAGKLFTKYNKNETYLNLFAYSCIKAGYLDRIFLSIVNLNNSKNGRENSLYYLTLLYQKNLIVSMILDNKEYSSISLPKTDHILNKIFLKLKERNYTLKNGIYEIKDKPYMYEVGVIRRGGKNNLFINQYQGKNSENLVKSYIFK